MNKKLPYKPLKKMRLYEEVANQIKKSIFDGYLKPGDSLPSERDLAQVFNVGRPTIREALRTLKVLGLVESAPGTKGSQVKDADITQYLEALREQLAFLIRADKNTLRELWEVRKYIELGISQAVAKNGTQDEIEELEKIFEDMKNCGKDIEKYFPLAADFHVKLAMASKNKIFYIIWEMFYDILLKGYFPILNELFPDGPAKLLNANRLMFDAIKSKDPDQIDKAMEAHSKEEEFFFPKIRK